MPSQHTFSVSEPRRVPAWLLSTILHLVSFLLIITIYGSRQKDSQVPERPVSIVLAPRAALDPAQSAEQPLAPRDTDSAPAASHLPSISAGAEMSASINLPAVPSTASLDTSFLRAKSAAGPGASLFIPSGMDPSAILAEEAARRQRELARGPTASIQLFGSDRVEGRTFIFLIDRSKSMGRQGLKALEAAEAELIRSLSQLQPHHRFQVMAYHHHSIYLLDNKLLPATPENVKALRGYLSNLAAFGATEHENAIRTALTWNPDVIFLLTDGGEPGLTDAQHQIVSRRAAGQTAIHCIQFGFGPRRGEANFLTRLAAENGGSYGYVNMSLRKVQ